MGSGYVSVLCRALSIFHVRLLYIERAMFGQEYAKGVETEWKNQFDDVEESL